MCKIDTDRRPDANYLLYTQPSLNIPRYLEAPRTIFVGQEFLLFEKLAPIDFSLVIAPLLRRSQGSEIAIDNQFKGFLYFRDDNHDNPRLCTRARYNASRITAQNFVHDLVNIIHNRETIEYWTQFERLIEQWLQIGEPERSLQRTEYNQEANIKYLPRGRVSLEALIHYEVTHT